MALRFLVSLVLDRLDLMETAVLLSLADFLEMPGLHFQQLERR
jgi:hypothetical protein